MLDNLTGVFGVIGTIISFIFLATGFVLRNYARFQAIYNTAKSAYFVVEEVATKENLISQDKFDLFEEKFKYLMSWTIWRIKKEDIELAHTLAEKFCNKYRKTEKPSISSVLETVRSSPIAVFQYDSTDLTDDTLPKDGE